MMAPRPQLICVGLDDPLTPPAAVERAFGETSAAYRAAGAPDALELFSEAGVGHRETPAMRGAKCWTSCGGTSTAHRNRADPPACAGTGAPKTIQHIDIPA